MSATLVTYDIPDGFFRWVFLVLMVPGLLIIFILVLTLLIRGGRPRAIPPVDEAGYYRILGLDAKTGLKRETLLHAKSAASARGLAAMEGIVVTELHRVDAAGEVDDNTSNPDKQSPAS